MEDDRVPFQATLGSKLYDRVPQLPVTILLDNIRSAFNAGSFLRTADAANIERVLLGGITCTPPHKAVVKTSLGAEDSVAWQHVPNALEMALQLRAQGYELAAIETSAHSVDLFDWQPRFPVCVIFGNEVEGVAPELIQSCDTFVRIPMLGLKHSLNVATAGGIVMYELLRKYRVLTRPARCGN